MGLAGSAIIGIEEFTFTENLLIDFGHFDARNLVFCRYLNLRHADFIALDLCFLLSLRYIDIAFARIREVNFCTVRTLKKVTADKSQKVLALGGVRLEWIFDVAKYLGNIQVSFGVPMDVEIYDDTANISENDAGANTESGGISVPSPHD